MARVSQTAFETWKKLLDCLEKHKILPLDIAINMRVGSSRFTKAKGKLCIYYCSRRFLQIVFGFNKAELFSLLPFLLWLYCVVVFNLNFGTPR
jgi:hypothetical protein